MSDNKAREELRQSLDSLLEDSFPDEIQGDEEIDDFVQPRRTLTKYANIKSSSEQKAKRTMSSLLKFYLSEEIIEENEYIKAKSRIDTASLGTLMYQMETTEKAITTLLEAIDSGEMAPRMFEVLGNLQKTLLDIVKSQTMYLIATEESMKKLSRELDISSPSSAGTQQNNQAGLKSRGTKELMRAIRTIEEEDAPEVEVEDVQALPTDPDEFDTGLGNEEFED